MTLSRVHNRFGGMRDLANFCGDIRRGMRAENGSGKWEFQLRAGAGFCVIKGSGCENRKGRVAGYGI